MHQLDEVLEVRSHREANEVALHAQLHLPRADAPGECRIGEVVGGATRRADDRDPARRRFQNRHVEPFGQIWRDVAVRCAQEVGDLARGLALAEIEDARGHRFPVRRSQRSESRDAYRSSAPLSTSRASARTWTMWANARSSMSIPLLPVIAPTDMKTN